MAVPWQYQNWRGQWKDMSREVCALLETEWGRQSPMAQFTAYGRRYEANFAEMRQRCLEDTTKSSRIRRGSSVADLVQVQVRAAGISIPFVYKAFVAAMAAVGLPAPNSPEEMFDFSRNKDFRSITDTGATCRRGGEAYKIPISWFGFGLKVLNKYDSGDNTWMKKWAVAYHGTKYQFLGSILAGGGLKAGPGQGYQATCGVGTYCSPDLATAQGYAAPAAVTVDGVTQNMQFILQCRVRPEAIRKGDAVVWVMNNAADIRPYRLLVKTA